MPIYINDFLVNSKNLYIAYFPNILCEVDKKSGQLLRRWKFSTEVLSLHGSENGRYLFARTEKNGIWIVDLGGAQ
jgi:16S rRNA C1402 (ribose-2'-O) methylase RsmI